MEEQVEAKKQKLVMEESVVSCSFSMYFLLLGHLYSLDILTRFITLEKQNVHVGLYNFNGFKS